MTTERLYYTDSYLTTFHAAVQRRSDDGRRVVLDRTAFYPTSGGQPHDLGHLGGQAVLDVVEEDDEIVHFLQQPLLGAEADGRVDWERRFDHMQQHTGQHLLSAVFADLFGYQTVSVHFGAEYATLDLEVGQISPAELRQAEAKANAAVTDNRPVSVTFEAAASAVGLRKTPVREGILRIVTIADLDRSACGGTHVRATGEIGCILIGGAERVKQQVRVEFRSGARAVARARADHDILSAIAAGTSSGVDEVAGVVEKQRSELAGLLAERRRLEEALHGYRARELYQQTTPDAAGRRIIVLRERNGSVESLRGLVLTLANQPGAIAIATLETPPTILLATAADSGFDAGQRLKPLLTDRGGRGGGSARLAQGTAPSADLLEQIVQVLVR